MPLHERVKTALDETRTLLLGGQILIGFEFRAAFEERFDALPALARAANSVALCLMVLAIGLLIAPSALHRIAERGESTGRIHLLAGRLAALGLLPFGLSLGLNVGTALCPASASPWIAILIAPIFIGGAFFGWFVAGWMMRRHEGHRSRARAEEERSSREVAPLHARIEQMLTETRVILPGAQAILGFQLIIVLSSGFDRLPPSSRLLHGVALIALAMAVILLVTPAALHRIVWAGEDSEDFLRVGGRITACSLLPLAIGIVVETFVVLRRATGSLAIATTGAAASGVLLLALWLAWPLALRRGQNT